MLWRKALPAESATERGRFGARPGVLGWETAVDLDERLAELNGIAAKGYLEKARKLSIELGLVRDLEQIDNFISGK